MNYNKFIPDPYGAHEKMVQSVGAKKKVLEVGCATGYISEKLKENGCNVVGIEINPEAAEIAKQHCDTVIIGDAESMEPTFEKKFFDVILFGDVLEHTKNPQRVLEKLKPFLKDEGHIVVSIPNIAFWSIRRDLLLGHFEYSKDGGILDGNHLRFFTLESSEQLLNTAGFQIVSIDIAPGFPLPSFFSQFEIFKRLKYLLSKLRMSLFAYQFIFIAKKRQMLL